MVFEPIIVQNGLGENLLSFVLSSPGIIKVDDISLLSHLAHFIFKYLKNTKIPQSV